MNSDIHGTDLDRAAWAGIRRLLVPPDIVAVPRRAPSVERHKTPWQPHPDGAQTTARSGEREWFSDNVFVDAEPRHRGAGYGTSLLAHTGTVALAVVVWMQPGRPPRVDTGPALMMPATLATLPIVVATPAAAAPAAPSPRVERTAPRPAAPLDEALPAAPADGGMPAPLEAPASVTAETGAETQVNGAGGSGAGGSADGVPGGVLADRANGGASSPGPLRVGSGIRPPRKIKDMRPLYPLAALSQRARGTVVIEATIGVTGAVVDARVVHSVALFDQAALDAVRQWEYAPSVLDGIPVAVIITVVVDFAIQ